MIHLQHVQFLLGGIACLVGGALMDVPFSVRRAAGILLFAVGVVAIYSSGGV